MSDGGRSRGLDRGALAAAVRRLHAAIRDRVVSQCEAGDSALAAMSAVVAEEAEDTIFAIDRVSEAVLVDLCGRELGKFGRLTLVAEGIQGGRCELAGDPDPGAPALRVIADPIDGTRGLMVQKRSGWILTAIAPERGEATTLADVEVAVQTEIPLVKQHLSDCLWAIRGEGMSAVRRDRVRDTERPLRLRPSRALTLRNGFAQISRFFPGGRDLLAAIDEELMARLLGPPAGRAVAFEDQYICNGGQLYELIAGHDRFVADLRPLLAPLLRRRGEQPVIPSHPYDLCTELIAREAGVEITDELGRPLAAPLDLESPVTWVGYANAELRRQIEPVLQEILRRRGLLEGGA